MNRIRLLPEQVANQIAAGEVVERPASVVKELVENALDASATRITVEIQAGGRSLVRVTDDGTGMSKDDALMCLERHATSKIQRAEDLASISTMGFRGEALPSIASVSRFSLVTRERDNPAPDGTQVVINGGKIIEVKAAGSAPGTSIEVRQIFFNLPARRKFLRSEETEAAHIQHYLTLAALSHPEVAFTFSKDGRTIWQLPAARSPRPLDALRERLRGLYGNEQRLLVVDFTGELPFGPPPEDMHEGFREGSQPAAGSRILRLWGFTGEPGVSRSTRDEQHLFVNRRPVENRGLNYALIEGYHTALMKGRYPVCCLFIEIDPSEVDVNIHPSKREVKFHHERAVRGLIGQAVKKTLLNYHTRPAAGAKSQGAAPAPRTEAANRTATNLPSLPGFAPVTAKPPAISQPALPMGFGHSAPAPRADRVSPVTPPNDQGIPTPSPFATVQNLSSMPGIGNSRGLDTRAPMPDTVGSTGPTPLLNVPLRLVGVVGKLYVVFESDRGMVLVDQHAAHERILFEQMLRRLEEQGDAASQRLLLPETVELPVRDAQFLREQLTTLTRLGVGLSEFGERTFLLDGLPPFVKVKDARRFVLELVDELKAVGQGVNSLRLGEHTVAKTVCRHAVKANDPLAGPELENLVNDLRHCDMPYTCPHGRPTLIEMNYRELEKKFGRQQ